MSNIYISIDGDINIPHRDNIIDVHDNYLELAHLTKYDPLFAGGYPMALFFAPRNRSNTKIKRGYYHDYDIYFNDSYALNKCLEETKKIHLINSIYETDNAVSISCQYLNKQINLQFIKKVMGSPSPILESFDFINCAVGYKPLSKSIYIHRKAPAFHNERKLEILNPWMLNNIKDGNISNIVIQIARFKKYCKRWEYFLSRNSINLLLKIYHKYPNIIAEKNVSYCVVGNDYYPYNRMEQIVKINNNVWKEIGDIILESPSYNQSMDKIGLINGPEIALPPISNNTTNEIPF